MSSPEQRYPEVSEQTSDVTSSLHSANQKAGAPLSPEVLLWAEDELIEAQSGWDQYGDYGRQASEAIFRSPNIIPKISHLYNARELLKGDGDPNAPRTQSGTLVADTMHLLYVPWGELHSMLESEDWEVFYSWLENLRRLKAPENPFNDRGLYNGGFSSRLQSEGILYRNPRYGQTAGLEWLSAREYVKDRMDEDGEWGVALAQTTGDAGVVGSPWQSQSNYGESYDTPDLLRDALIRGVPVNGMGVYERIAVTLQARNVFSTFPQQLIDGRQYEVAQLLPANRVLTSEKNEEEHRIRVPRVGFAYGELVWDDERVNDMNVEMSLCVI